MGVCVNGMTAAKYLPCLQGNYKILSMSSRETTKYLTCLQGNFKPGLEIFQTVGHFSLEGVGQDEKSFSKFICMRACLCGAPCTQGGQKRV